MPRPAPTTPASLPWTGDPLADRLIAEDPLALLIGFELDQQVTIEKAFSGPRVIRERLGTLDAASLAALPPDRVAEAFAQVPAVHRYPRAMATRVQALCRVIAEQYGGRAQRLWTEAEDAAALQRRIAALPGFGTMKATTLLVVLVKRFGVRPPGWEAKLPQRMTLADVVDADSLRAYRALKREYKAAAAAARVVATGAKPKAAAKGAATRAAGRGARSRAANGGARP